MKILKKIVSFLDQAIFGVSAVSLAVLAVTAVIFRFCFNNPIQWAEEVEMILVVWAVFFGSSIAVREKGHIAVDILYDAFPEWLQKIVSVLIWIVIFVAIAGIGKLEIDRGLDLIKGDLRTPVLRLPSYIEYIGVVFACFLMLVGHIISGVEDIMSGKEKKEDE